MIKIMQHPFLQKDVNIRWSELTPEHVERDINKAIEDAQAVVDAIAAHSSTPVETLTYEATFAQLDEGLEPLSRAWGLVGHLDSVCNSPELREVYNKMLPKVTDFFSGIYLNETLWKTVKRFGESVELTPVSTIAAVFEELARGKADYGLVPIENSIEGSVIIPSV